MNLVVVLWAILFASCIHSSVLVVSISSDVSTSKKSVQGSPIQSHVTVLRKSTHLQSIGQRLLNLGDYKNAASVFQASLDLTNGLGGPSMSSLRTRLSLSLAMSELNANRYKQSILTISNNIEEIPSVDLEILKTCDVEDLNEAGMALCRAKLFRTKAWLKLKKLSYAKQDLDDCYGMSFLNPSIKRDCQQLQRSLMEMANTTKEIDNSTVSMLEFIEELKELHPRNPLSSQQIDTIISRFDKPPPSSPFPGFSPMMGTPKAFGSSSKQSVADKVISMLPMVLPFVGIRLDPKSMRDVTSVLRAIVDTGLLFNKCFASILNHSSQITGLIAVFWIASMDRSQAVQHAIATQFVEFVHNFIRKWKR